MTLNINIYNYIFNEALKAKFICPPCVPPVACPAALCDSCLLFVCLWRVHRLNSYDFQRPEKRTAREERLMHHLACTPEPLWVNIANCSECQEYLFSLFPRGPTRDITVQSPITVTPLQRANIFIRVERFALILKLQTMVSKKF